MRAGDAHPSSVWRLAARGWRHDWRRHGALALAAAVAAAVLVGSLLVGASMRQWLRRRALERLGRVEWVLASETFFRDAVADAIPGAAPIATASGSAQHASRATRTGRVQVLGVDSRFWALFAGEPLAPLGEDEALVNPALAAELGAAVGDELIVRALKPSAVGRETFVGERDATLAVLRVRVAGVVDAVHGGDFAPLPAAESPFNLFVPLQVLQRRMEQPGRVNMLAAPDGEDPQPRLRRALTLGDAGLTLTEGPGEGVVSVFSPRVFLSPAMVEWVRAAATDLNAPVRPGLVYLANTLRIGEREVPYSTVAAVDDLDLSPEGIALNAWAAEDLAAAPGDRLEMVYYLPVVGELIETTATLTVARVLPMDHPLVDRRLTPDFPGIRDAEQMARWDPPFPIDLRRIRPRDEAYWERWRAAPKAFVALATGERLWSSVYGSYTSLRVEGVTADALREALMRRLDAAKLGLVFEPVRQRALDAAQGASDFGALFVGFSAFLVLSAALLLDALFRLAALARGRQYGLLLAVGWTAAHVRRLMLAEAAGPAAMGVALGTALGLGYAWLLLWAFRTHWRAALGTADAAMTIALDPSAVLAGALGGWVVALASIVPAARQLARRPPRAWLAGHGSEERASERPLRAGARWGGVALACGAALAALGPMRPAREQAALFFASGAFFLAGALLVLRGWLRGDREGQPRAALTLRRLTLLGARRHPSRSMLVAASMAAASFILTAVGAHRRTPPAPGDRASGSGGLTLLAESSAPLFRPPKLEPPVEGRVWPLRLRPGEDASCLNPYRVQRPRVLGVGPEFVARGGFAFAASAAADPEARRNPWVLLERPLPDGAIPAIGDAATVVWLLHAGLGREIEVDGHRLRFVALLEGSIFQREVIVSEASFRRLYPQEEGWRIFAIETPPEQALAAAAQLESRYADEGLDAHETARLLEALLAVENAYLSAFLALGGLGLLLGTGGLALVLLRNLIERRAEWALLRAVGWTPGRMIALAAAENAALMLIGLGIGAGCGLAAVLPGTGGRAPWGELALTLALVAACGGAAVFIGADRLLRGPIVRVLKEE